MPNKSFSVLYSPSTSKSYSSSKSKSTSKNKSRSKNTPKSRTLRSKIFNDENKYTKPNRAFGLKDITNRQHTMKLRYSPQRSWRKNNKDELSLKSTRDSLSKLLEKQNWKNKIAPNDIIKIQYNPIKEMHIHLYKTKDDILAYHIKSTFPLHNWSFLLQYNPKENDYDFVIKNEMQNVLMRENWKNKKEIIERFDNFKTIDLSKDQISSLMNHMLDIVTIIEKSVKTNVIGGSKKIKTKKRNYTKKRKNRKTLKHRK